MKSSDAYSHLTLRRSVLAAICVVVVALLLSPTAVSASGAAQSYRGWIGRTLNANAALGGVSCPSASVCYLAGGLNNNASTIEKTTNGGASWSRTTFTGTTSIGSLDSVSCADVTHCLATGGGRGATAFATTDGTHWSRLALPAGTAELINVTCLTDTSCWAVGVDATGVMTTDGGASWSAMPYSVTTPGGSKLSSFGVAFTSANAGVVVGGTSACQSGGPCAGYIQVTNDGGHTWSFATAPAGTAFLRNVTCLSNDACLAVGFTPTHSAAYRSINSGATWSAVANPAGIEFAAGVTCHDSSNCVAIGQSNTATRRTGPTRPPTPP
jgi:photosystem II stability/assembly factor-like uncharacterized protein